MLNSKSYFRFQDFYATFLFWKTGENIIQNEDCFSLNFDYYDIELSTPQITITPDFDMKTIFLSPSSCFFIIIGGRYLKRIGHVMEKLNSVTKDVGGNRPLAVFLISNSNKKTITIDMKYGLERYKSTPVMVN